MKPVTFLVLLCSAAALAAPPLTWSLAHRVKGREVVVYQWTSKLTDPASRMTFETRGERAELPIPEKATAYFALRNGDAGMELFYGTQELTLRSASTGPGADVGRMLSSRVGHRVFSSGLSAKGQWTGLKSQDHQKLVAQVFSLPKERVAVGESWPLDVKLVRFSLGGPRVETLKQVNQVTLEKVRALPDGTHVAHLRYLLEEEEVFGREASRWRMREDYRAEAQFAVEAGQWLSFQSRSFVESDGPMKGTVSQEYFLKPVNAVPEPLGSKLLP